MSSLEQAVVKAILGRLPSVFRDGFTYGVAWENGPGDTLIVGFYATNNGAIVSAVWGDGFFARDSGAWPPWVRQAAECLARAEGLIVA